MNTNLEYRTITREQFLFHEMRTVAKLKEKGLNDEEIIKEIFNENLFQYPTERMIKNLAKVCINRFNETDSNQIVSIIANDSSETAKQACLFVMMNYYRLVWDFMIGVIGEKYRIKDLSFTRMDMNVFFTRMQEQNETIASWSDLTIDKSKQVLRKLLVDNGYLDNTKSEVLNPVLLDFGLKNAIESIGCKNALVAFNCFD